MAHGLTKDKLLNVRLKLTKEKLRKARLAADEKLRANGLETPHYKDMDPFWGISSQVQQDMEELGEAVNPNGKNWDRVALRVRRGE